MERPLHVDKPLLEKAFKISGLRTRRATVEQALSEFILKREQLRVSEIFGTVDFDPDYHYKVHRRHR